MILVADKDREVPVQQGLKESERERGRAGNKKSYLWQGGEMFNRLAGTLVKTCPPKIGPRSHRRRVMNEVARACASAGLMVTGRPMAEDTTECPIIAQS